MWRGGSLLLIVLLGGSGCGGGDAKPAQDPAPQGTCGAPLPRELTLVAASSDDAFFQALAAGVTATVREIATGDDPRGAFLRIRTDALSGGAGEASSNTSVAIVLFGATSAPVQIGDTLKLWSRTTVESDGEPIAQRTTVVRSQTGALLYAQASAVGTMWPSELLPELEASRAGNCGVRISGSAGKLALPSGGAADQGAVTLAVSVGDDGRFALALLSR